MEEVTTSNLMLSMPSTSRSVLREEALAAWRFQPVDAAKGHDADAAWIFEASQRDMEIVTRALVTELNSRPDERVTIRTSNEKNTGPSTSEVASSSMSSCDPGSPSQASVEAEAKAIASVEVSDSMASQFEVPRTRSRPAQAFSRSCNNQRSILAMNNFAFKRRSRKRNRAPITNMRADPADLQATVQQITDFPLESSSSAAPSLLSNGKSGPAESLAISCPDPPSL